jgi:hypothetical protein
VQKIEGDSWRGSKFDRQKLDKMSGKASNVGFNSGISSNYNSADDQIVQLYELLKAIKNAGTGHETPAATRKES